MIILESGVSNYILANGRKYFYFGGNNYLGLANHPGVKSTSALAVGKYGINFSASRITTGTGRIHLELEEKLSLFKGKEDTVVFASGYQGNTILLEILKEKYSCILADELCHASIKSAIPRDRKIFYFKHCNAAHLDSLIVKNKILKPLIITDGIFALTGEIAPLDKIFPVAIKHKGILVVDDAHSTGILGKTGKGTPEYFGIHNCRNVYQTETMSKALGSYGGFISGSKNLTTMIRENSAIYQASTSLPPPVVAAAIASLKIIEENPGLRNKLLEKAGGMKKKIISLGYKTTDNDTPIAPLIMSSAERAKSLSLFLEKNGMIVPFMNYPFNRQMYILRIAITSDHTSSQIKLLLDNLEKWIKKNGKNNDM